MSVDISAVAYFRVVHPVKSVVAIENVNSEINQIMRCITDSERGVIDVAVDVASFDEEVLRA